MKRLAVSRRKWVVIGGVALASLGALGAGGVYVAYRVASSALTSIQPSNAIAGAESAFGLTALANAYLNKEVTEVVRGIGTAGFSEQLVVLKNGVLCASFLGGEKAVTLYERLHSAVETPQLKEQMRQVKDRLLPELQKMESGKVSHCAVFAFSS